MTDEHDAIDELLAGYVLEALSGADADEADRLLVDHVPRCDRCRETLDDFAAVVGDLGMSVTPVQAPDLLWPRIERELEPRSGRRFAPWSGGRVAAAVAAVVAVVGIAGLVVTTSGADAPALANADIAQIRSLAERPDAETTDVGEVDEVTAPGVEETYVMGTNVSMPPPGTTYRLWAIHGDGSAEYVGDFTPINGTVALEVHLSDGTVQLLVTFEPAGSEPGSPGQPAWPAA